MQDIQLPENPTETHLYMLVAIAAVYILVEVGKVILSKRNGQNKTITVDILQAMQTKIDTMNKDLAYYSGQQEAIKRDVNDVKSWISGIRSQVGKIANDMAGLNANVDLLVQDFIKPKK